jgi:hypothetical protein
MTIFKKGKPIFSKSSKEAILLTVPEEEKVMREEERMVRDKGKVADNRGDSSFQD